MTNPPADLAGFRGTVMRLTGLTNPADVGIVGDGLHQRTGGYHEGKDVLAALGVLGTDYSDRLARDRAGLTLSASALDIGSQWPNGGRAAWLRFNNLLVAQLHAGDPDLVAVRATNYSPDGTTRLRTDREAGWSVVGSTDVVDIHTHIEWYRDTEGKRQACLDRLAQLIAAAIQNLTPEDTMAFLDDPNAAALSWRMDALHRGTDTVQGGPTKDEPMWAVTALKAVQVQAAANGAGLTDIKAMLSNIKAALNELSSPTVDLDALAAKVVALMPTPPTAAEVAAALIAQLKG